ncbi:MAG: hypothetical protein WBB01_02875 [Phormidesmis sp.]
MKRTSWSVALVICVGCGPEVDPPPADWVLGAFSTRTVGEGGDDAVENYVFEPDGAFVYESLKSCGGLVFTVENTWTAISDTQVRVPTPDLMSVDAFVFERQLGCDEFRLVHERGDQAFPAGPICRGEICLHRRDCPEDGGNLPCVCSREYCGDPPPEPLECE